MYAVHMTSPAPDATSTRLVQTPEPAPGPGEVSIDVAYAGINFMDVMARRGDPGYAPNGWPHAPGLEVAGTIRALGPGVRGRRAGEQVAALVAYGGLAEVAIADSALTARVPEGLDLAAAAAAPLMLGTAVSLLRDAAQIRDDDSVFMHSAGGGVGSVVPQVAAVLGAGFRVGTVAGEASIPAAKKAGWDEVVVAGDDTGPRAIEAAGKRFDVILDPTGTTSLDTDLVLAAPGARIVLFGNAGGTAPGDLPPFGALLGGNIGLVGFSMTSLRKTAPHRVADALATGLSMLAVGDVRPPITVVESLEQTGSVHDLLANRAGSGKYVVRVAR